MADPKEIEGGIYFETTPPPKKLSLEDIVKQLVDSKEPGPQVSEPERVSNIPDVPELKVTDAPQAQVRTKRKYTRRKQLVTQGVNSNEKEK